MPPLTKIASISTDAASFRQLDAPREMLPALPKHLASFFEERPLLPGEDPTQYDEILHGVLEQVKPSDAIEAVWIKDVIDLIWEARRLRLWRQKILMLARLEAAKSLISPIIATRKGDAFFLALEIEREAQACALGWLKGSHEHAAELEALLQERGLTVPDVYAHAFQLKLSDLERLDRMAASTEKQRDTLLHEIERRRANLSQRLRIAASEIIDVE